MRPCCIAGVVFLHPDWVQLVGCGGVVLYVNRTDLCVSTSFEVSPRGETCGGLICDEMGLGKTLQVCGGGLSRMFSLSLAVARVCFGDLVEQGARWPFISCT